MKKLRVEENIKMDVQGVTCKDGRFPGSCPVPVYGVGGSRTFGTSYYQILFSDKFPLAEGWESIT
jgi:hypothetical protein